MTRKRPYVQTDPPREWARKKILDLEEAVAALKTRLDEQGAIIDALKTQRPSRFLQSNETGIDWRATSEREAERWGSALPGNEPRRRWVPRILGRDVEDVEDPKWSSSNKATFGYMGDDVDLNDPSGVPLLKLSHKDVWMLNRLVSYPRVPFEEQLEDLKAAGVTDKGRELGLRLIYGNQSRDGLTLREHTLLKRYFALLHRAKARV